MPVQVIGPRPPTRKREKSSYLVWLRFICWCSLGKIPRILLPPDVGWLLMLVWCVAFVDAVDPPADSQRHPPFPVPLLRQTLPPEVRHEEAHLHTHRWGDRANLFTLLGLATCAGTQVRWSSQSLHLARPSYLRRHKKQQNQKLFHLTELYKQRTRKRFLSR